MRAYEAQVRAGIALLNEEHGGTDWLDRVDLETLDLMDGCCCVLGQVYGSYRNERSRRGWNNADARPFGFFAVSCVDSNYNWSLWRELEAEWRLQLTEMKQNRVPAETTPEQTWRDRAPLL